jgi:hypothetical protein
MVNPPTNPTRRDGGMKFTDDVLDDAMAEVLRMKEPAERLEIAFSLWRFARDLLQQNIRRQHPEWDEDEIRSQVARRMSHGAV